MRLCNSQPFARHNEVDKIVREAFLGKEEAEKKTGCDGQNDSPAADRQQCCCFSFTSSSSGNSKQVNGERNDGSRSETAESRPGANLGGTDVRLVMLYGKRRQCSCRLVFFTTIVVAVRERGLLCARRRAVATDDVSSRQGTWPVS